MCCIIVECHLRLNMYLFCMDFCPPASSQENPKDCCRCSFGLSQPTG